MQKIKEDIAQDISSAWNNVESIKERVQPTFSE
jgi:hypothetical protein